MDLFKKENEEVLINYGISSKNVYEQYRYI